jgi:hypothetical protein
MDKPYNAHNCSSLFGYAQQVHERSAGICQLCGCNAGSTVDFDLWRQFTWEHIIGESQGGYLKEIQEVVAQRFPDLPQLQVRELAKRIEAANTVTACSFCNSTTSREHAPATMNDLILHAQGSPDDVVKAVETELQQILAKKRERVRWKIDAVREAFEKKVASVLNQKRQASSHM